MGFNSGFKGLNHLPDISTKSVIAEETSGVDNRLGPSVILATLLAGLLTMTQRNGIQSERTDTKF